MAGSESISAGEGVAVLDPDARPGLDVSGGGTLTVRGRVVDNSEGGVSTKTTWRLAESDLPLKAEINRIL